MVPAVSPQRSLHVVASLTGLFAVPKPAGQPPVATASPADRSVTDYRKEIRKDFAATLRALRPGPAFPFIRGLTQKRIDLGTGVDIRILSRHPGDWSVIGPYRKLFEKYGLNAGDREVFMSNHYVDDETGAPHANQRAIKLLRRLHSIQPIDLYLATNKSLALMALEHGIPTVLLTPMTTSEADAAFFKKWSPENSRKQDIPINVETDLDSTLFDSMSDWFWHLCNVALRANPDDPNEIPEKAILLFLDHERRYMNRPMGKGIAFPVIDGLKRLREIEIAQRGLQAPWESAISYSGLTMRANASLDRAMLSAYQYGFTDMLTFDRFDGLTQRLGKDVILRDEEPQIMFEDSPRHIAAARSAGIPVGIVLRGPYQLDSLRMKGERQTLLKAQKRLYAMAEQLGYEIKKEQVERYVEKLLAPYKNP
jgi:hypothetical protein